MGQDQIAIFAVLAATVGLLLWGRWRHDLVALVALVACVALGLVPARDAFAGFAHPAVITVAAVLVLSHGLQLSGVVAALARWLLPAKAGPTASLASLVALGAALSAFMNNVGAMALLLPVGVQLAHKHELPPGKILMPLSFGTILGGMTTLIGTPPNLIVAGFRADADGASFAMFDFARVGLPVAFAGVALVVLFGRRLVPERQGAGDGGFETGTYLTEARVPPTSKAVGRTLNELEDALERSDAQIVGLVRDEVRLVAPHGSRRVLAGDILVLEADPEKLAGALSIGGLELEEGARKGDEGPSAENDARTEESAATAAVDDDASAEIEADRGDDSEVVVQELVPMARSPLVGRSANDLLLRTRYGVNLLAISRRGRRSIRRLRSTPLGAGDVLLVQGPPEALRSFAADFACVPLAERGALRIPDRRRAVIAALGMAAAIAVTVAGWVPAAVAFTGGVVLFAVAGVLPPRRLYEAVDGSVVVLLAALFPVAAAMESTGAAGLLARSLLDGVARGRPIVALAVILVVTMTLSDFMNNAATAAIVCPIALGTADQLGAAADPFLMAVAIGASCAFLTPIGHQNNTLILGPGGFRFGDYWRLGLPMEIVVVAVALPLLTVVWPL
jgi:di/tricarboxylate transporter